MVSDAPYVMLIVQDMGQSLCFYRDRLGLTACGQDEWGGHQIARLMLGDFSLVLFQQPPDEQESDQLSSECKRGDGVILSFPVASIDELLPILEADGRTILREVMEAPWGEKTLVLTDPDGYAVLLSEEMGIQI